jgi:hypothetical protein
MAPQHIGEGARDIVHAALDHADADVLPGAGEQPGELCAERVVGRKTRMHRATGKEIPDLGRFESLLGRGPHTLELKAVFVNRCGTGELCRESWRRRIHACGDGRLGGKIISIKRPPGLAVLRRELREALDRRLETAADGKDLPVGIDLRPIRIGRDQLEPALGKPELLRRRRQFGDEIAARVNI